MRVKLTVLNITAEVIYRNIRAQSVENPWESYSQLDGQEIILFLINS
jgi:hypothetical protein